MLEIKFALLLDMPSYYNRTYDEARELYEADDFYGEQTANQLLLAPKKINIFCQDIPSTIKTPAHLNFVATNYDDYVIMKLAYAIFSIINRIDNNSSQVIAEYYSEHSKIMFQIIDFITDKKNNLAFENYVDFYNYLSPVELTDPTRDKLQELSKNSDIPTKTSGLLYDKDPMSIASLLINAKFLGIEVITRLPKKLEHTKYNIIASEKSSLIYTDGRDDITTINLDIQGNISCLDNALIIALKAKQIGFDARILLQNDYAVVLISNPEDFSIERILNTEIVEKESLWEQYKDIFLKGLEHYNMVQFLKDFIQVTSIYPINKFSFPPHNGPPEEPFLNPNSDDYSNKHKSLLSGNITDDTENITSI